mmetsp:Transcript_69966/g.186433  ORF Transcript_69966/g.186433 Transcript_69966/m.186433 type:complete len:364 (-) Transcript_69966:2225-3316(-)
MYPKPVSSLGTSGKLVITSWAFPLCFTIAAFSIFTRLRFSSTAGLVDVSRSSLSAKELTNPPSSSSAPALSCSGSTLSRSTASSIATSTGKPSGSSARSSVTTPPRTPWLTAWARRADGPVTPCSWTSFELSLTWSIATPTARDCGERGLDVGNGSDVARGTYRSSSPGIARCCASASSMGLVSSPPLAGASSAGTRGGAGPPPFPPSALPSKRRPSQEVALGLPPSPAASCALEPASGASASAPNASAAVTASGIKPSPPPTVPFKGPGHVIEFSASNSILSLDLPKDVPGKDLPALESWKMMFSLIMVCLLLLSLKASSRKNSFGIVTQCTSKERRCSSRYASTSRFTTAGSSSADSSTTT